LTAGGEQAGPGPTLDGGDLGGVTPQAVVGGKEGADGRVVVENVVLLHEIEHNDGLSGFSIGTLLPGRSFSI
jgi:hypothetical protein